MTKEDKLWILRALHWTAMTIVVACRGDGMYVREDWKEFKKLAEDDNES